jgi:PAS domain-containing protein
VKQNAPSRERLIQELENLRSRVRELERLDRQRRRALEELKIRDERFMAIVESSPLAIVCTDLENAVTLWNSAAERMFGWSAEEVLGKPLPYVAEEMREDHMALRRRVLSGESFSGVEVHRIKGTGINI